MIKDNTEKNLCLGREEMQEIASKRVSGIAEEFRAGFEFLAHYPMSVTFFGSSKFDPENPYYKSAETLASRIVREVGCPIVSGGGPGIMEAANKGAHEAGGDSLGLLIELPEGGQRTNEYITKSIPFHYFFVRKVCLAFSAETFIFFPGGFGTMDELFELLTLIQTKKVEGVPLVCVGKDYWEIWKKEMEKEMLDRGAIDKEDLDIMHITDNHDEVIDIIKRAKTNC